MYEYHGDRATGICQNGHFCVAPFTDCKQCGMPQFKLKILSNSLRLPVKIYGYLANSDGYAIFKYEDGVQFMENEESANKNYLIHGVIDQALVFSRLFLWGIATI